MDVGGTIAELSEYYEAEAAAERRPGRTGFRVDLCDRFVDRINSEGRRRVLDIGAGPGTDAVPFVEASLSYTGVDLAIGNALIASRAGHLVIPASLFDLPFSPGAFDAAWSMSTLMHVPDSSVDAAVRSIMRVMCPGAPVAIGMWGGSGEEFVSDRNAELGPRLFSLRTAGRNQAIFARHCDIESFVVIEAGPDNWEYHFATLRAR